MIVRDTLGLELTGATGEAADAYRAGLVELQTFTGDPAASAQAAIDAAPDFVMGHVLKGWLHALATDSAATAVARQCWRDASRLPASHRERGHVAALGALVDGQWLRAGEMLAAVSQDQPLDALALQAGHQIDFFTGNAPMLRDRIAKALPSWDDAMPGYHAVLSAHAFGLEETGDYAAAERAGRRAVEIEPRDGWGRHAVAHVMEMQGRQRDGIAWMRHAGYDWSDGSFLRIHNWWHLALFHYELGEIDAILDLYDGPLEGGRSAFVLNLVDAAAILWRLHLGGHAVGARWLRLADLWAPLASAGNYAFNDAHAMMAFVGAGRPDLAKRLLAAQAEAVAGGGDNAMFTRDIGGPAARAILAFGEGDFVLAADLLEPLLPLAHRFGGSHAQRDVLDLTLIEAALRAGDRHRAGRLARTRLHARPDSPLSHAFTRRVEALERVESKVL